MHFIPCIHSLLGSWHTTTADPAQPFAGRDGEFYVMYLKPYHIVPLMVFYKLLAASGREQRNTHPVH